MRKSGLVLALALAVATPGPAVAQYPTRPVTIVAPFPAGGPSDTLGRILSEPMRAVLGQPVVIENVAGAGGNLGVGRVARAAPTATPLGIGNWSTHVVNGATYKLPYDVLNDFEPIALLATTPQLIIVAQGLSGEGPEGADRLAQGQSRTRRPPATVGAAGGAQVCRRLLPAEDRHHLSASCPIAAAAPAMQDLIAGQVDIMFDQAANALAAGRSRHRSRPTPSWPRQRWPAAPDVPTMDEAGMPGLHVAYWHGLWAPKGTPKDIIAKLNAAVVHALADPNVRKRFAEQGQDIWPADKQTPEALAAHHKAEIERWWPIVRSTGLKAE